MSRRSKQDLINIEAVIYKFFEEFGIKPGNKAVSMFIDHLNDLLKTPSGFDKVDSLKVLFEEWLEEKYNPDMFTTGGTINTSLSKDGSRLPDEKTQKKLLKNSNLKARKKVIVYEYALDSSNQNLLTQEKLMNKLGKVAFEDIKKLEGIDLHLKKPGKYICIDRIPYHFNFPKPSGPGTLITHGTDTLVENAALSAYMMLPKTLVWTGSWSSPDEKGSDAYENIEKAKLLANNSLTPIGVYIVIGDEIHLATRTKKINTHPWKSDQSIPYSNIKPWRKETNNISYFATIDDDPVGYFNKNNQIYFNTKFLKMWEEILVKRFDSYFPLEKVKGLQPAYVEHVYINEHTPGDVFKKLINRLITQKNRCGAIIEGNFSSNSHYQEFVEMIQKIDKSKGIFILSTSKTKLSTAYKNLNYISSGQLRIKLSALLGRNDVNNNNLMLFVDENLAGEILEQEFKDENELQIPKSFYQKGEFIIAFPGMTRKIIDDAIENINKRILLDNEKPVLLINGYGDGHIPIGYLNMEERLTEGFSSIDPELCKILIDSIINDPDRNELSVDNIVKHLTYLLDNKKDKAKTLLRKVFINSNDLLASIGRALDEGIEVLMGTKVDYAIPNLGAYEIGTILQHIGVKPLKITTKEFFNSFDNIQ